MTRRSKEASKGTFDIHHKDTRLKKLEDLHKHAGVSGSLRLPEGKRIKLNDTPSTTFKSRSKKDIDFDIKFTELEDCREDSPEDLPDSQQLLASMKSQDRKHTAPAKILSSPPSTDYSNPDLEAIMRTVDTEDMARESDKLKGHLKKRKFLDDSSICSSADKADNSYKSCNTDKHSQDGLLIQAQTAKKTRLDFDHYSRGSDETPLFLEDPPLLTEQADSMPYAPTSGLEIDEEDHFALDSTLFDIVPSLMTVHEPEVGMDLCHLNYGVKTGPAENHGHLDPRKGELEGSKPDTFNEDGGEIDEEWADFEDWLNSGAVKIVES